MNYSILLVDDVAVNRLIMEKILSKGNEKYVFYHAENGEVALELLSDNFIDLIILDLMMPEKDGFYVLTELKKDPHISDIPVIVYTAVNDMGSISRTLQLGALDFFLKPLSQDQMDIIIPQKVKNALTHFDDQRKLKALNHQMMKDLELANTLQNSLMNIKEELEKWNIQTKYYASAGVSGDIFDFVQTDDGLWLIIADVVGHGLAAAMTSTMVKVMFRYGLKNGQTPANLLNEMNTFFCNLFEDDSVVNFSAFIGKISNNTLLFSNAGHPYPVLVDYNDNTNAYEAKVLKMYGFTVGLFTEATFDDAQIDMSDRSCLLCFTDGIFGEEESSDRVYNTIEELVTQDSYESKQLLERLETAFHLSHESKFVDDIAVFTIFSNGD